MDRTGQCLCGAVRFTIRDLNPQFGTCHCKMCQRWAGSALLGLAVPADTIRFEGKENINRYQSSDWAERAWCGKCGSGLWYQVTAEGPHSGTYHMPIGLLDDTSDLTMTREIFTDTKPDCVAFEGEREQLDTAATLALFGVAE
ncbi:GFA family protein [Profundibacter sp.]|uniref:GFA family protein n=1 Tax=Profundibacter sp. TaxID=3101071 RepID=UPI003D0F836F